MNVLRKFFLRNTFSLRPGFTCSLGVVSVLFLAGCSENHHNYVACGDPLFDNRPHFLNQNQLLATYQASALGSELQESDLYQAAQTAQEALTSGAYLQPYVWTSCVTGTRGVFTLLRAKPEQTTACVAYRETIHFPVKTLIAEGLACQDEAGFWRLITQHPPRVLYKK